MAAPLSRASQPEAKTLPHPRRFYQHNQVVFFTIRLAEGLPFVPNEYISSLIRGIVARACGRNPLVRICGLCFLQNHYHGVAVITGDPAEFSSFLHDLDDELARLTNRLLGRRNVKVWGQRPHVAVLADWQAVIEKLAYTFLNPVSANFCDSACEWTGVSTYSGLCEPSKDRCRWIPSRLLGQLPNARFTARSIRRVCAVLDDPRGVDYDLDVNPLCWKSCFAETAGMNEKELRDLLLERIRRGEDEFRRLRKRNQQKLADLRELGLQNPHKPYKPASFGHRVYCIATDPELRTQFIGMYQTFCLECMTAWNAWKQGDFSAKYPPGAFIPPHRPFANVLFAGP